MSAPAEKGHLKNKEKQHTRRKKNTEENIGELSAKCLLVDQDPLTETLSFVSYLRDRKIIWTGAIVFKVYCIEKKDTMPFFLF